MANFLIDKSDVRNGSYIKARATTALDKFLITSNKNIENDDKNSSQKTKEMNLNVFDCLLKLLYDDRRRIKVNACSALAEIDTKNPKFRHKINSINQSTLMLQNMTWMDLYVDLLKDVLI